MLSCLSCSVILPFYNSAIYAIYLIISLFFYPVFYPVLYPVILRPLNPKSSPHIYCFLLFAHLRVKHIAQTIAERVERNHGQNNENSREQAVIGIGADKSLSAGNH